MTGNSLRDLTQREDKQTLGIQLILLCLLQRAQVRP